MASFNSLGSNYTSQTGHYFLGFSPKSVTHDLTDYLKQRYQMETAELSYKGREAITLVLAQLGLPKDSYVAVNGYTCYAVYQAIVAADLKPLYLDIAKNSLNFGAAELEAAFPEQPNISAVMIQNTLGLPAEIDGLKRLCDSHGVALIEDLAHCVGLRYPSGQEAGTVGTATALSFSQDKMVDAVSGGAALLKTRSMIKATWRPASLWHRFTTRLYPWKSWLIRQTFQAGVGRVLLKVSKALKLLPGPMSGRADRPHFLPRWHSRLALKAYQQLADTMAHRQSIAAIYRQRLPEAVQFIHREGSVYVRFPILVADPQRLIDYLKPHGIFLADRWYDAPIAPQRMLDKTDYQSGQCPNAEYVAKHIINLPTHLNISQDEAVFIVTKVSEWLEPKP